MKINKETLIRDSEKLRVIESMIFAGYEVDKRMLLTICGYTTEKENIDGTLEGPTPSNLEFEILKGEGRIKNGN